MGGGGAELKNIDHSPTGYVSGRRFNCNNMFEKGTGVGVGGTHS